MTQVSFEAYHDEYIFQCIGHSGYSEYGADIVCAAVSILCYTLGEYLSKAQLEGRLKNYKNDFSDGYVIMSIEPESAEDTELFEGIDAILGGFRLLSENFPLYVSADL